MRAYFQHQLPKQHKPSRSVDWATRSGVEHRNSAIVDMERPVNAPLELSSLFKSEARLERPRQPSRPQNDPTLISSPSSSCPCVMSNTIQSDDICVLKHSFSEYKMQSKASFEMAQAREVAHDPILDTHEENETGNRTSLISSGSSYKNRTSNQQRVITLFAGKRRCTSPPRVDRIPSDEAIKDLFHRHNPQPSEISKTQSGPLAPNPSKQTFVCHPPRLRCSPPIFIERQLRYVHVEPLPNSLAGNARVAKDEYTPTVVQRGFDVEGSREVAQNWNKGKKYDSVLDRQGDPWWNYWIKNQALEFRK